MKTQNVKDLVSSRKVKDLVLMKTSGYKFNGKIWTRASTYDIWSSVVHYCADLTVPGLELWMQTLDDAVEFRHDMHGANHSAEWQNTGTLLAIANDGKAGLRAHVYEPNMKELVHIADCAYSKAIIHGYDRGRYFDFSRTSDIGKRVLKFSDDTQRHFVVPKSDLELAVNADEKSGVSEYSENEVVRKLMPRNARKNAAYIAQKGYSHGLVQFERYTLQKDTLRILPVNLGSIGLDVIHCIVDAHFGLGHTRGVALAGAREISTVLETLKISK